MSKLKINIIAINAKSGAGKDYIVSYLNFIDQCNSNFHKYNYTDQRRYNDMWKLQRHTNEGIDQIINNPTEHQMVLNLLHDVSSSEIKTDMGIDWNRSDLTIERFSTPLRMIVQAVGGTEFTPDEMDSQETKKYKPDHLNGEDYRDLHTILSDAVKEKTRPDIFAKLLEMRVIKKIKSLYEVLPPMKHNEAVYTIIVLDMRYPEELITVNNIMNHFSNHDNITINVNKIHIKSKTFNAINHSSEQDLFGQYPYEFNGVFENDKTRTTTETLAAIKKEIYDPIIESLNN